MKSLYLVKIGGSVITDIFSPNTPRIGTIDRLMHEIKKARQKRSIIMGHGAGSFGHVTAHIFKVNNGLRTKRSKKGASMTQLAASDLHSIVMKRALKVGINALSFSPSTGVIAQKRKIISWDISPIKKALDYGFLPICYGDLVIDSAQGVSIASTEEVLRYIAIELRPKKIIVGTDVDGVFDVDPKSDKSATLIKRINKSNISEVLKIVSGSKKIDVTGGMKTKLEHLYTISKLTGATCQIVNAAKKGSLYASLTDRGHGTIITAN